MTAPNYAKLGRNQRYVLDKMRRYNGVWAEYWFTPARTRRTLDSLIARGLVTYTDGVYRLVVTA